MRKKWKYGLTLFLTCGVLAGCGKTGNKDSSVGTDSPSEEDYVYVSETEAFGDSDWIGGVCSTGEKVYITTYGEEDDDNRTVSIDLSTRERTSLSLPLEQDGSSMVNSVSIDSNGNLVFFKKTGMRKPLFIISKHALRMMEN